ncbi:hypothetical protein K7X08_007240 [Anisodus acutangulus]|uniref:Uncharacterized protein n=1 Tax=Anisodus acutangulus TaxID=402998 RepID=A0A9Q1LG70_9SOLA|nr:hypothetical protein K7X08_007240 [Anisodus acutangulus]
MFFNQIIIRFVFSILLVRSSSSVEASNSTLCDQHCGAGSNAPRVPYPFGFSDGCGIRLNCTESTGDIRIGEYLIQHVTSDALMVNFPVNCSRPIEDLQQFGGRGTNYGMTWRNELLLQNCRVLRSDQCIIPSEISSARLNILSCDSKKENVSCYSEANADYLDYSKLRNTGCGVVVSSILISMDNDTKKSSALFLEFQVMELAWGLEGDCACDDDAYCTNVILPGNRNGFRCRCKDGFIGDGFRDNDGCRKERSKAKHLDSRVPVAITVPVAFLVLVLCSCAAYYKLRNSRKAQPWNDGQLLQIPRTRYRAIHRATDGFSEANLVATFLVDISSNSRSPQSSAALKGSIGYIPTEYGSGGQASTLGDVYSFGIVLLELFICRRPTDVMFNENLNIHKYVSMALPASVMEIVDPILLFAEKEQSINQDQARKMEECLLSVLEIGLTCSASSPRDRMSIDTALSKLQALKKSFL